MSSPDIAAIIENAKELDRLRKEQEEVLLEINKMHRKLQTSEIFDFFFTFFPWIFLYFVFSIEPLILIRIPCVAFNLGFDLNWWHCLRDTVLRIKRGMCDVMIVLLRLFCILVSVTSVGVWIGSCWHLLIFTVGGFLFYYMWGYGEARNDVNFELCVELFR